MDGADANARPDVSGTPRGVGNDQDGGQDGDTGRRWDEHRGSRWLRTTVPTDRTAPTDRTWMSSSSAPGSPVCRYRDGSSGVEVYAEDYAYLIFGLLELFQADGDADWLEWALTLQARQDELFWDPSRRRLVQHDRQGRSVLLRLKEDYDGAEPAASSVSVLNLLMLSHLGVREFFGAGSIARLAHSRRGSRSRGGLLR